MPATALPAAVGAGSGRKLGQVFVDMHGVRCCVLPLVECALGKVRPERSREPFEVIERPRQAIEGSVRIAACERWRTGNRFGETVLHRAAGFEGAEGERAHRRLEERGFGLREATHRKLDALREMVEHLCRRPSAAVPDRPTPQRRERVASRCDCQRTRSAWQYQEAPGTQTRHANTDCGEDRSSLHDRGGTLRQVVIDGEG